VVQAQADRVAGVAHRVGQDLRGQQARVVGQFCLVPGREDVAHEPPSRRDLLGPGLQRGPDAGQRRGDPFARPDARPRRAGLVIDRDRVGRRLRRRPGWLGGAVPQACRAMVSADVRRGGRPYPPVVSPGSHGLTGPSRPGTVRAPRLRLCRPVCAC
jgi:hypothetical protein